MVKYFWMEPTWLQEFEEEAGYAMTKNKWRPQILAAIVILGGIAAYGMFNGMVEVATGCVGGVIALGMKLMENE